LADVYEATVTITAMKASTTVHRSRSFIWNTANSKKPIAIIWMPPLMEETARSFSRPRDLILERTTEITRSTRDIKTIQRPP
jgi:hypothetical protein